MRCWCRGMCLVLHAMMDKLTGGYGMRLDDVWSAVL